MHQRKTTKIDEAKRKKLGEIIARLRKIRFKRQTGFCKKFKEVTGEDLSPGTMSQYESDGGISERRLKLVVKTLGLNHEEEQQLAVISKDAGLRYVIQHKPHGSSRKGVSIKKKASNEAAVANSPVLPANPELQELQNSIEEMRTLRGFMDEVIERAQGVLDRLREKGV